MPTFQRPPGTGPLYDLQREALEALSTRLGNAIDGELRRSISIVLGREDWTEEDVKGRGATSTEGTVQTWWFDGAQILRLHWPPVDLRNPQPFSYRFERLVG